MNDYYAQEIAYLRELGAEYAQLHPSVAPLLATRSTDPDVERLLEGTAFLCGLIHERLDQNFPEIAHALLSISAPAMLLPRPSECIVQFTPAPTAPGVQEVAAGAQLRSVPVQGASCTYALFEGLQILPVARCQTGLERLPDNRGILRVRLDSSSPLEGWLGDSVRFFLHGNPGQGSDWFWRLCTKTGGITVSTAGGAKKLPASALRPVLPPTAIPYSLGREHMGVSLLDCELLCKFFIQLEDFLFVELEGLGKCSCQGNSLELAFAMNGIDESLPDPAPDLFRPNTGIAINVFPHSADPFVFSNTRQDYRLTPQKDAARELEIYAVNRVTGVQRGGGKREYLPYRFFAGEKLNITYTLRRTVSQASGRFDYYINLLHNRPEDIWENETLTTEILCYNRHLPKLLHEGDISVPTDSSPAMATFRNILPPSLPTPPLSDPLLIWTFYSCLHANMLPLATASAMREFMSLCLPVDDPDPTHFAQNLARLYAIRSFTCHQEERLVGGRPVRGQRLDMVTGREGFSGTGEMFVLGTVLDEVLASFATINTYTRFELTDGDSGTRLSWPARLGKRRLL